MTNHFCINVRRLNPILPKNDHLNSSNHTSEIMQQFHEQNCLKSTQYKSIVIVFEVGIRNRPRWQLIARSQQLGDISVNSFFAIFECFVGEVACFWCLVLTNALFGLRSLVFFYFRVGTCRLQCGWELFD